MYCLVLLGGTMSSGVDNAALGTASQMSADGMAAISGAPTANRAYVFTRDRSSPRPSNWSVDGILSYTGGTSYMEVLW